MKLKKMLLVISIVIISMFSLMLATSYAWYSFDNAKTTFNAVTNDDIIEVSYQSGEYINTSIAVPITSDQIDKYSDKSNFSVRVKNNKDNNDVMVAIKLVDVVIDSQLRKSTFRVDLYYQGSQINTVRGTDIVTAVNENLGNVVLEDDVSNQFEIRVYIIDDGTEQNLMMDKTFSAKISVDVVSRLKTELNDYSGPDIYVDSITIDGEDSDSLPVSGYYDMDSTCDKGSVLTWDPLSKIITYESDSYVEDVCSLTFTSSSSYPLLSEMPVGSYVKYTGTNGCDGKHCEGENANYVNDDKMGYCFDEDYQFITNGWRIGYVEDGSAHLISAGAVECTDYGSESTSFNTLNPIYFGNHYFGSGYTFDYNTGYFTVTGVTESEVQLSSSVVQNTPYMCYEYIDGNCVTLYKFTSYNSMAGYSLYTSEDILNGVPAHLDNLDDSSLKYCNKTFSKGSICDYTTAWSMDDVDYQKIINNSLETCDNLRSDVSCGYNNDLIDNGGFYWYGFTYEVLDGLAYYWDASSRLVTGKKVKSTGGGVRPIVKLDSAVMVTGGSGTYEDPYTIINYPNTLKTFDYNDDRSYFHSDLYRTKIKNVSFVDYIDTSSSVDSWDMSKSNNGSIIAWVNNNATDGYYDLYIGSENPIKGTSLAYYFSGMTNVDSISFDNLDTSLTANMGYMFRETGYNSEVFTLDLGENFDTSNVTNMHCMFHSTGYNNPNFTLDLGSKFDTSKVTNMGIMFFNAGYNSTIFTLDLGEKFDTSKVKDMSYMFFAVGYSNPNFTFNFGNKFDTSNVTNMEAMINRLGYSSTVFTLDLGDKFNTSKVTNMYAMFYQTGYTSPVFTINLGDKFDTSKVEDMSYLFSNMGYSSTVMTLDLGDKFDTSNAINMASMFNQTGRNSTKITLDLGDKFDTSKVTDMRAMFYYTGASNPAFVIDLGNKFNTSNVTNMASMFSYAGHSSTVMTLDLGSLFNTSNVTNMEYMFNNTGNANANLVLDLSMFTFDQVTTYGNMFYNFKTTHKIYVKNTSDQSWITSKGFTNVTTSNVLVKS